MQKSAFDACPVKDLLNFVIALCLHNQHLQYCVCNETLTSLFATGQVMANGNKHHARFAAAQNIALHACAAASRVFGSWP